MEIRLKREWMGHREGSTLNLMPRAAERLISLGTAVDITKKEKEVKEEVKAVSEAPKDKMVRRPKRKK